MATNLDHERNNFKMKPMTSGTHRYGWGCNTIPQSIDDIRKSIESCELCQALKPRQVFCASHEELFLIDGELNCLDPTPSPKVLFKRGQEILS